MSDIIKPLMLDETGKAIVEALTQKEMTQTRIAEIDAAADTAKAAIEAKTDEQAARIPEVTELAADVGGLKDDISDITVINTIKKARTENPEHKPGYYWGGAQINDGYFYVELCVKAGDIIHALMTLNNTYYSMRFIDAYNDDSRVQESSVNASTLEFIVPDGVNKLYISINVAESQANYIVFEVIESKNVKSIVAPKNNKGISTKIGLLASGNNLIVCKNIDNKKNQSYRFTAKLSGNFNKLLVGHGYNVYAGSWIAVDADYVTAYYYNGSSAVQMGQWAHNLAISDFIDVIINVGNVNDIRAVVTVVTKGGDFVQGNVPMGGCRGDVFAFGTQDMTDVKYSYSIHDIDADVWLFGDSYTSLGDPNRWTHQLMDYGYKNILMCGFSGAMSDHEIAAFRMITALGKPRYIVWALGMNDADSEGVVNARWKAGFDEVTQWCEKNKVEFIGCTIPNTPNVRNIEKNEVVRDSGFRYVDFAKAVDAEEAGATWYSGMLSSDNVHPAVLGAKALANRFLIDVPEVSD